MAIKILNDLLPIAEQTEVGVVKPDNVSITITETGELQSSVVDLPDDVVTAENYDNPKLWKGTLEEYNAIETKDPLVTYIITDDNVETLKTTDYNALSNKPSINDVTLEGNKTLEELNIQPADTSLTTSQITNCITKIPQDIKFELNNNTLTLKAGSKVYIPNGPGIFDEVITENDLSNSSPDIVRNASFIVYRNNNIQLYTQSDSFSGPTAPTPPANNAIWYDTTNNLVKFTRDKGITWETAQQSLPICLASSTATEWTSIDQVFNGFGYIGSTLFALPGVEGLIPNGRNNDGSLNNIAFTINQLLLYTLPEQTGNVIGGAVRLNESVINPTAAIYDEKVNFIYLNGSIIQQMICGYVSYSSGRFINFTPKLNFQAIDRNDTEWASTASKPSSRYIDLTLGASDSTYSAPANGWVWLRKHVTEIGQYVELAGNVADICYSGRNNTVAQVYIPVKKNEMFRASYTATGATVCFRFIYDEGVK